jgi:hypothetical protein
MDLKEAKVAELVAQHGLPSEIVSRCVSDDGAVDDEKLDIALQSANFGITAKSAAAQLEIEALQNSYKALQDEAQNPGIDKMGLAGRMMVVKSRLQAWVPFPNINLEVHQPTHPGPWFLLPGSLGREESERWS